mgnify:CR=1 FL=1
MRNTADAFLAEGKKGREMQYQKEVLLKDGTLCVLRGATETDAAEVLRSFKLTHAETDFLLTYPEENSFAEADEAKFLIRHRAEFGIAIEKAYWGRGIGKALMLACIECAKKVGYLQLELEVVADNASAVRLYESVGFREFGRNPRGFRAKHGWQELILMRLELDQ